MTQFLFLLSPAFICGFFLLVGETIYWARKGFHIKRTAKITVRMHTGRE